MNNFHWIEAKQLDRATNFSTRIEPLKYANSNNIKAFYYCTFSRKKKYFGLKSNINYLGQFKNRYAKAIEFQIRVILKAITITLRERNSVLMVNQPLIKHMLPAICLNRLFRRNNKFITDIRTIPTETARFNASMKSFHGDFKYAVKHFDGFSFITPFMEKYIIDSYNLKKYKSVNWSSGVDIDLFNPENNPSTRNEDAFRLFYHGGISVSRGNLSLIKAIEQLIGEGYALELVQVGITVDKEIQAYIDDHKISGWCKLLPPVPITEIPQMIADCDIPVMPFPNFLAWRVSSPIKLMEYLAMGKRVLVPNMEAFTEVFVNSTDLVFYFNTEAENQVEELANSVRSLIDSKVIEGGNFSIRARKFVADNYTWEKQAENLFSFANSLWEK